MIHHKPLMMHEISSLAAAVLATPKFVDVL